MYSFYFLCSPIMEDRESFMRWYKENREVRSNDSQFAKSISEMGKSDRRNCFAKLACVLGIKRPQYICLQTMYAKISVQRLCMATNNQVPLVLVWGTYSLHTTQRNPRLTTPTAERTSQILRPFSGPPNCYCCIANEIYEISFKI